MKQPALSPDAGSSLPELLVAAGLTLTALTMLVTTVLAPLAVISRWSAPDERRLEMDRAVEHVVAVIGLARPGLEAPAVLSGDARRIEVRVGDLRHAQPVVLLFDDGRLSVEMAEGAVSPDTSDVHGAAGPGVLTGTLIEGIDTQRSGFVLRAIDGRVLTAPSSDVDAPTLTRSDLADVAVIEVAIVDAPGPDGSPGRTEQRTTHLRLRLPLAGGRP